MNTKIYNNENINEAEEIGSLGVRYEVERVVEEEGSCEVINYGRYAHPEHTDSNDWAIWVFRINGAYVASTNGDPVWADEDLQAWAELMAEYEIEDDYTYEVREGLYYKLIRRIGQEDYYYATDENDNRISIDRPDVDGDWTSDTTGKSFAFLP